MRNMIKCFTGKGPKKIKRHTPQPTKAIRNVPNHHTRRQLHYSICRRDFQERNGNMKNTAAETKSIFADRLKEARTRSNLSREELALEIHKSSRMIARYEQRESSPTFGTSAALASALNVSLDWLFGLSEST